MTNDQKAARERVEEVIARSLAGKITGTCADADDLRPLLSERDEMAIKLEDALHDYGNAESEAKAAEVTIEELTAERDALAARVETAEESAREQFATAKHNADAYTDLCRKNDRLREAVDGYRNLAEQARHDSKALAERVAVLEGEGEPVAWRAEQFLSPGFDGNGQVWGRPRLFDKVPVSGWSGFRNVQPLYAHPTPEALARAERAEAALRELVTACEADFGVPDDGDDENIGDGDDEAVGGGLEGDMAITFGMLRRARAALLPAAALNEVGCGGSVNAEATLRAVQEAHEACRGDFFRCEQCGHEHDGAVAEMDHFLLIEAALSPAPTVGEGE